LKHRIAFSPSYPLCPSLDPLTPRPLDPPARRPSVEIGATRSFWIVAAARGEIREEALPEPAHGDVVVESVYSGVSRGTELLVFEGKVPESERERMRAPFQAGAFPCPVKYGYSSVGRVVEGPGGLVGKSVFCLHPHQTRYVVPAAAVVALPRSVPEGRAILAANMETALNGFWDAGISAGDRVAVVGAGVVGSLVAYLAARCPGTEVELVDIDSSKASVADALGATFKLPDDATRDVDVVIHASGSPDGLRTALDLAGTEATVTELSWFGTSTVELPLGAAFHSRRLRIQCSQVGSVPAARRARWTNRRRLELAVSLLGDNRLDVVVTGESRFEDLPNAMTELSKERKSKSLCRRITYR
jgi:2-desacetyl-2-hydroxyethyl bacteriochlorophyllide A dehydrogenase